MAWVIIFVISWLVFLYLVDWSRFRSHLWKAGVLSVLVQLAVDWSSVNMDMYIVNDPVILIFGSSAFFTFGPVFTMGILFIQYYPAKRGAQAVNALVWSTLFLMIEIALRQVGALDFLTWGHHYSIGVDFLSFGFIAWAARLIGAMDDGIKL